MNSHEIHLAVAISYIYPVFCIVNGQFGVLENVNIKPVTTQEHNILVSRNLVSQIFNHIYDAALTICRQEIKFGLSILLVRCWFFNIPIDWMSLG